MKPTVTIGSSTHSANMLPGSTKQRARQSMNVVASSVHVPWPGSHTIPNPFFISFLNSREAVLAGRLPVPLPPRPAPRPRFCLPRCPTPPLPSAAVPPVSLPRRCPRRPALPLGRAAELKNAARAHFDLRGWNDWQRIHAHPLTQSLLT